ncbi:TfoX/Sxy family protein [bacterium]|nr:TfoX/Sxy family protein [bacterium]
MTTRSPNLAQENEFVDHLLELLKSMGSVNARRMFGGYGVYHDGLMFGLVANNTFYIKTDEQNRSEFEALGLGPFEYDKKGKIMKIAYYEAPAEALESPLEMLKWAESGYRAALRGQKKKASK